MFERLKNWFKGGLQRAGMYCVDDHGHPIDAWNNSLDEARYANNHFVKNYVY